MSIDQKRFRWFRFRLRTVLLLVTLLAIPARSDRFGVEARSQTGDFDRTASRRPAASFILYAESR